MVEHPYIDEHISSSERNRTFSSTTDPMELVWHRDTSTRFITVLDGEGWSFQFDNELPFELNKNDEFMVPKMVFHRLLKSDECTDLKLRIIENQ